MLLERPNCSVCVYNWKLLLKVWLAKGPSRIFCCCESISYRKQDHLLLLEGRIEGEN